MSWRRQQHRNSRTCGQAPTSGSGRWRQGDTVGGGGGATASAAAAAASSSFSASRDGMGVSSRAATPLPPATAAATAAGVGAFFSPRVQKRTRSDVIRMRRAPAAMWVMAMMKMKTWT